MSDLTATISIGDALYPLTDFKIEMKHDMLNITSLTGGYLKSALPVTTTVTLTGILKPVPPDTEEEEKPEEKEMWELFWESEEDSDGWCDPCCEDDDDDCERNDECMCDECLQREREQEKQQEKAYEEKWAKDVQYSTPIPLSFSTPPHLLLSGLPPYYFNQLPQEPPKGDTPMPLLTQPTNTKSFRRDKAQLLVDALKERVQAFYPSYGPLRYTIIVEIPKEVEPTGWASTPNPSKGTHIINNGVLKILCDTTIVALFPNGSLKEMVWMEDAELKEYVKAQIEKQEGEYRQKLTRELMNKFGERLAKLGYHRWVLEHDYIVPAQKVPYSSLASYTPRTAMETYVAVATDGQTRLGENVYVRVGTMHELVAMSDEEFKKKVAVAMSYREQVRVGGAACLSPAVTEKTMALIKYVEKS